MRILLQNGSLVRSDGVTQADLLIENGRIAAINAHLNAAADETLDAAGKLVFPGLIDTHTHFDLDLGVTKTADDFVTGTRAAILGGTTTVLDFCTQDRGMTMAEALSLWREKAKGASCDYGFHMAISEWNDARSKEIERMVAEGITSFKMYMVYDAMRLNDGEIYAALKRVNAFGCVAGVHCENYDLLQRRIRELHDCGVYAPAGHPLSRPAAVEAEAVARLMRISELAGTPVWVVHLSTEAGLIEARRARERGQEVYLETCPQYLVLDDSRYLQPDADKFVMSPPLRKKSDESALLSAMGAGEIDFVGTDHCSFTMAQKALGNGDFAKTPNGGAGVQNRAQLVYTYAVKTGRITLSQMAAQLSENAAKLFGMYPQKGALEVGADADIALYDPSFEGVVSYQTNTHNCDNSPFEGIPVTGRVTDVFLSGAHVVRDGAPVETGRGKYVFRKPPEKRYRA